MDGTSIPITFVCLVRRLTAKLLGSYSSAVASSFTFVLVASEISGWSFKALDTVDMLIPNASDSSFKVLCFMISNTGNVQFFWRIRLHKIAILCTTLFSGTVTHTQIKRAHRCAPLSDTYACQNFNPRETVKVLPSAGNMPGPG